MQNFPSTPFPNSYWVVPGKLLAGEYPADKYFESVTQQKIDSLLDSGIELLIDLTHHGELPPYNALLHEIAGWYGKNVEHKQHPTPDYGILSQEEMSSILDEVDAALECSQGVYIHCQQGIGRTGTVIGCYLVRQGMSGEQALEKLSQLRRDTPNARFRSPESQDQFEMVKNWLPGQ